ncbi:hypothetical protein CEUSTIGMA_g7059.t1 [Chlamydomonas eustigma]|uniref:CCHC-type domain-containing protein n=1 Tax=Chlamydomonas eustigma TaxID=1157962 RepID=A0A250X974_9CHLO|nr:hypothetical protein CEUSTIGMA_g7059.t1 [Chlamydomonas eustigma]|eukprot:GAX79618.1 hypothetical protein CEUSTIGMA_g7059.t1 [Chlamydomonas eustigma]
MFLLFYPVVCSAPVACAFTTGAQMQGGSGGTHRQQWNDRPSPSPPQQQQPRGPPPQQQHRWEQEGPRWQRRDFTKMVCDHCQTMGHGWRKCPYIGKAPPGAQQPAQPVAPGGGGGGPHGMAGLLVSVPNHQQDDHQQQQGASLSAFDRNDHQDAVTMPHVPPTKWIVDTGSTRSNTPYRELLHDYKPVQKKKKNMW